MRELMSRYPTAVARQKITTKGTTQAVKTSHPRAKPPNNRRIHQTTCIPQFLGDLMTLLCPIFILLSGYPQANSPDKTGGLRERRPYPFRFFWNLSLLKRRGGVIFLSPMGICIDTRFLECACNSPSAGDTNFLCGLLKSNAP